MGIRGKESSAEEITASTDDERSCAQSESSAADLLLTVESGIISGHEAGLQLRLREFISIVSYESPLTFAVISIHSYRRWTNRQKGRKKAYKNKESVPNFEVGIVQNATVIPCPSQRNQQKSFSVCASHRNR